jgi:hypothetical protein
MTLRHALYFQRRRKHLDRQLYTTSQFAQKAAVTARTLRFYDKVGLLSPSVYTEAGHRLYSDEDLWSLRNCQSCSLLLSTSLAIL